MDADEFSVELPRRIGKVADSISTNVAAQTTTIFAYAHDGNEHKPVVVEISRSAPGIAEFGLPMGICSAWDAITSARTVAIKSRFSRNYKCLSIGIDALGSMVDMWIERRKVMKLPALEFSFNRLPEGV